MPPTKQIYHAVCHGRNRTAFATIADLEDAEHEQDKAMSDRIDALEARIKALEAMIPIAVAPLP